MTPARAGLKLPASDPYAVFVHFQGVTLRGTKRCGLTGLNWTWRAGEQWAIVGPDQAGKALLIEALQGRVHQSRGHLELPFGSKEGEEPDPRRSIAVVSPETQRQLILEQVSYYQSRWQSGLPEGQRTVSDLLSQDSVEERNPFEVGSALGDPVRFEARRRQVMRWLGLRPLWARPLAYLSNGELRKALLAYSLLREPRLLVLEDPLAGLDVSTRTTLKQVIATLMRKGLPVLVVTHRLNEIPAATTHLLLVEDGRVIAQGRKRPLLRRCRELLRPCAATPPMASSDSPVNGRVHSGNDEPLVELRNVTVSAHARQILRRVSWTVRRGERWVLLGPNGAGKTTLLNLIQGDHPQAYSQDLRLFGRSPDSTQSVWQARQLLGWMSPELHQHYPPDWSAQDVVASGFFNTLGLYDSCSRAQRSRAREWLRRLHLTSHAREAFGHLPFGQQRLILLARALVKRPRLVILDEPCQGLDPAQRAVLLAAVDGVVAETDCAIIFVTHRKQEVPLSITHLLRLERGRVVASGPFATSGIAGS